MEGGIGMSTDIPLYPAVALETEGFNKGCPSMTPYLLEGEGPYPVMIVCPGGSYIARAHHEGEPVAKWLNTIGISAVVLNYRVAPFTYPSQLMDAQRAIRLVRHHAVEWNLDHDRVGILGFSAGGHLAATAGTHFDHGCTDSEDPVEWHSSRPDLMVLCYPAISLTSFAHAGCNQALLGEHHEQVELLELLSNEKQVTADTPPAFLWHTVDDGEVPVEHTLLFAQALQQHKIAYDLHLFESGSHGIGLAVGHREAEAWPALCEAWLKRRTFITGNHPAFDDYSTVGELLSNEEAKALFELHLPGLSTSPYIEQMRGLSLKMLFTFPFPLFTEEKLVALTRELASIPNKG